LLLLSFSERFQDSVSWWLGDTVSNNQEPVKWFSGLFGADDFGPSNRREGKNAPAVQPKSEFAATLPVELVSFVTRGRSKPQRRFTKDAISNDTTLSRPPVEMLAGIRYIAGGK
jgi:hypothetical protein